MPNIIPDIAEFYFFAKQKNQIQYLLLW